MTQTPDDLSSEESTLPIEIGVEEVKQLLDSESELFLIDCRETNESEFCRIEGACLIPMNETPNRLNEIEPHRNSRIVIHCHHGGRSLQVAHFLRQKGFNQTQNMTGGIDAWSQSIDPSVPRY